jgi:flagellum-specific ATP synthase
MNEPIGDAVRSILDGHVVLHRKLAQAGHFPSIEVLDSVSRVAPQITTQAQRAVATEVRRLLAAYREAKDLLEIGAYVTGTNPAVDRAIQLSEPINNFLRQGMEDSTPLEQSWNMLAQILQS